MLYTSRMLNGTAKETEIYLGYRNNDTFLATEFEPFGTLNIVSEDGSVGYKGNVLDAIKEKFPFKALIFFIYLYMMK